MVGSSSEADPSQRGGVFMLNEVGSKWVMG